jgi:hypothetical protein
MTGPDSVDLRFLAESAGQCADLDQVVGQDALSGPDPGSYSGHPGGCDPIRIRVWGC